MAKSESSGSTASDAEPSKPQRSATEKLLVRGGIVVLLIVVGIEFFAQKSFQKVFDELQLQLEKADAGNTQITKSQVDTVFQGRQPDESKTVKAAVGEERYDLYNFPGLLKKRLVCIRYGVAGTKEEPEVISVTAERPDQML